MRVENRWMGRTESVHVGCELGHVEAHLHVRLRPQVVQLIGTNAAQRAHQRVAVGQVRVVRLEPARLRLRAARVLQSRLIEVRRPPHRSVNLRAREQTNTINVLYNYRYNILSLRP